MLQFTIPFLRRRHGIDTTVLVYTSNLPCELYVSFGKALNKIHHLYMAEVVRPKSLPVKVAQSIGLDDAKRGMFTEESVESCCGQLLDARRYEVNSNFAFIRTARIATKAFFLSKYSSHCHQNIFPIQGQLALQAKQCKIALLVN